MYNNFVKDVKTNNIYLLSDLMQGKKTTVKNCGLTPMSGIIACPQTGGYIDLVELFSGRKVYITKDYDMFPISGTIQSSNGEIYNLVELILSCSTGGSGEDNFKKLYDVKNILGFQDVGVEQVDTNMIVESIQSNQKYFYAKTEEQLFIKDNIFTFNGVSENNDESTKFCTSGVSEDIVELEKSTLGEGYIHKGLATELSNMTILREEIVLKESE